MKIALLLSGLLLMIGCGPESKGIGGAERSFLRDGEKISFKLQRSTSPVEQPGNFKMFGPELGALILPALAGTTIDLIKQEVEDDIARHTTSWDAVSVANDFTEPVGSNVHVKYDGAHLVRHAALNGSNDRAKVFELEIKLDSSAKNGLIKVAGKLKVFEGSRAKIGQNSRVCALKVTISAIAKWRTNDQFQALALGDLTYSRNVDISGDDIDIEWVDMGVIPVPPANSALVLNAKVAEADPKFPKKTAESTAKLLETLKPIVIKEIAPSTQPASKDK